MVQLFIDTASIDDIIAAKKTGQLAGVTTNPTLVAKEIEKNKQAGKSSTLRDLYQRIIHEAGLEANISFEVTATTYDTILQQARHIHHTYPRACVKIPVCSLHDNDNRYLASNYFDCIKAIHTLSQEGIPINCTLIHRASQGALAAQAGATLLSPFVGRLNDHFKNIIKQQHPHRPDLHYSKQATYPTNGVTIDETRYTDREYGGALSGTDLVRQLAIYVKTHRLPTKILAASIRNLYEAEESAQAPCDYLTVTPELFHTLEQLKKTPPTPTTYFSQITSTDQDIHGLPLNWNDIEYLHHNDDITLRSLLYHPKSVEGMTLFLNDIERIKEEYGNT